jgi:hypothetical protein
MLINSLSKSFKSLMLTGLVVMVAGTSVGCARRSVQGLSISPIETFGTPAPKTSASPGTQADKQARLNLIVKGIELKGQKNQPIDALRLIVLKGETEVSLQTLPQASWAPTQTASFLVSKITEGKYTLKLEFLGDDGKVDDTKTTTTDIIAGRNTELRWNLAL